MSQVKVNGKLIVHGKFSVSTRLDTSVKPHMVNVDGIFQTAEYIEEITKLESERYIVDNVKVLRESFGSEEDDIFYEFTASKVIVKKKGGKSDGRGNK